MPLWGTNYHENWCISGQHVYHGTHYPIIWISRTGKSLFLWAYDPDYQTDYDHLEHKLLLPRAQIPNFGLSDGCALLRKEGYFLDAMRVCCAGLDVHQAMVVACLIKGPLECKPKVEIREFPTVLSGLLALQDWISEEGCTDVAMESTGVYWKPINNVLESTCDITLGNARHIKNLPGRKTDVNDARWIAELHRSGLIRKSFVAPQAIRELRDLTRYRKKLKGYETSERNRILKILEDANIKISTYMSDVFGVSGRLMLNALIHGEVIEAPHLAELAKASLRTKIPELTQALNGRVTKHHRYIIKQSFDHLLFLEQQIAEIESDMEHYFAPYQKEIELLDTIPGVGVTVAQAILAEFGADMSVFPSEAHISSWAGLSPGNNESAGKKKVPERPRAIKL